MNCIGTIKYTDIIPQMYTYHALYIIHTISYIYTIPLCSILYTRHYTYYTLYHILCKYYTSYATHYTSTIIYTTHTIHMLYLYVLRVDGDLDLVHLGHDRHCSCRGVHSTACRVCMCIECVYVSV